MGGAGGTGASGIWYLADISGLSAVLDDGVVGGDENGDRDLFIDRAPKEGGKLLDSDGATF